MATYDNIPLTWNDPLLNGATNSGAVTLQNGGTLSYKSITADGSSASVYGNGSFNLDHVRIDSSEAVRIGGSGNITISNSYLEATGSGSDHADVIQAYAPGGTGDVTITNTTIVAHNTAATAGMFIADDYAGKFTFNNVVFEGGPFGLRMHGGGGDISISLTDVYFVGPFQYDPLYLTDLNITHWENVRYATIVNGELVPGALIPPPLPVQGGGTGTGSGTGTGVALTTIDHLSTDSGVAGDGITNDNTLTLTGTAAANSKVVVSDGTAQIGTATSNASGTWSYTTAALNDGSHSLTAKATNAAGNTSAASAALAVKIDTTAPTAPTMTSGPAGAAGTSAAAKGNTVALTGTAEANSTVKVFDGAKQVGTATADGKGAWNLTTDALATGSHSLTAKATDVAGNTGAASKAVAVSVNPPTTPPTTPPKPNAPDAPKIASYSNDSGVAGDHVTNDKTLTLAGTAAANSKVVVSDGTAQIGTATSNASGAWSYTTAALNDGSHSLTAKVTNAAGTSTASAALALKIDTAAPNAPKIAAGDGTVNADHVTLTGTAEANSKVMVFDGAKQLGTATTNDKGAWTYAADSLSDGSHHFTTKAMDAAGNTSASSTKFDVKIDTHTAAHSAEFTKVVQNWNDTVTFKGTADPHSQINIYDNGHAKPIGSVKVGNDGTWSYKTPSAVSEAVHNFTATVTDKAGNTSKVPGSAVLGTNGNDALKSTSGNDLFKGNGGHDTFVFKSDFGADVIKGFDATGRHHDVVQFSKSVFDNFADVLSHAAQSGHDVAIHAGGSNTLTLKDTKLAALDKHDFHFA
jgi:hypothetical protein